MDTFGIGARIEHFDKQNGGNPILAREWFLYENGAVREVDPLGALIDPPTDEYERLSNIVRFHNARREKAVREFDEWKEQMLMSGSENGESFDHLKHLQRVVGERNRDLEQAKSNLAKTTRGRELENGRRMDAEMKQRNEEFRDKVRAMRV